MSRVYSAAELELFARYVPARADHRPAGCNYAAECWVEVGPPGMMTGIAPATRCTACGCSLLDGKRGSSQHPIPRYPR